MTGFSIVIIYRYKTTDWESKKTYRLIEKGLRGKNPTRMKEILDKSPVYY